MATAVATERVSLPLLRGSAEGADCEHCPFSREGQPNKPVFSEYPEKPKWILIGEGPGRFEVVRSRPFCLVPETLVLMADLTWRTLAEVKVGDQIITFEEEPAHRSDLRRWVVATVTQKHSRRAEAFRVGTERGELIGSAEHRLLTSNCAGKKRWLRIDELIVPANQKLRRSRLVFVGAPWKQEQSFDAGWLSGFMDGEGHVTGSQRRANRKKHRGIVGFSQNAGPICDRASKIAEDYGFVWRGHEEQRTKGVVCVRRHLRGGYIESMRFLGIFQPSRLVANFVRALEGQSTHNGWTPSLVWQRESVGERELIDISTTAGTFIANGFVVHNCGPTGELVDKLLTRIGRPRGDVMLNNATLCFPITDNPEDRHRAASACKTRLQLELARHPGVPILTLGAPAARAVIPKDALDAIDPPDVPESKQKRQKKRQKADEEQRKKDEKLATKRANKLEKFEAQNLKALIKYQREVIREATKGKASKKYIDAQIAEVQPVLIAKAKENALKDLELFEVEAAAKKAAKPKKKKPIKITDIAGTFFEVDVDGTGVRPVIPTIHPASLLHGGGRSIAGSHTPDLAYVNLTYDFGKIDALAQGKDIQLRLNVETEGVDAERATRLFVEAIQRAFDEGEVGLDLETYVDDPERHHALMAYVARVRAIGLATKDRSISVLWDLIQPWAFSYFQVLLASTTKIVTQNGIYDRTVLRSNGFEICDDNFEDTLYAHHSAFPGCAHNLQTITAQFFAVKPWKSEFRNAEEDTQKLLDYNAHDTGATLAIKPRIEIVVKKNHNERTYEIDRNMAEIAGRMHAVGMPVSREVNTALLNQFSKSVAESRQAVEQVSGDPKLREQIWHHLALEQAKTRRKADLEDFESRYNARLQKIRDDDAKGKWRWKISGGKHVAALLQALGVSLHQVTKSGSTSTKKEILENLVDVPIVRDLLTYRENDKLLSTFVWQIFDREFNGQIIQYGYADANDRIHPIWNVHKISGRWASYEPVVSNVPKAKLKKQPDGTMKEIRPNLRRQIKVTRPGRKLVGFDFSQLEARNLALISGDEFLCSIFADGKDIHTECSRVVFSGRGGTTPFDKLDPVGGTKTPGGVIEVVEPCTYCKRVDFHHEKCKLAKMKKQLRDLVKQVEYGAFYGGSPETLWKVLLKEGYNVKLSDVADAIQALMAKMPGIVRWQRQTVAKAALPPHTIKDFVMGRRRVFPMGQVDPNEALNFESQSTAAAIMNTGMARMDVRLACYREAYAIVQVHDAAAFEVWEDDAEDVAQDVKQCFEQEYERDGRRIPYPVDIKIGDSWDQI